MLLFPKDKSVYASEGNKAQVPQFSSLHESCSLDTENSWLDEVLYTKAASLAMQELTIRTKQQERYEWANIARHEQLEPPGDWRIWLILAGRGFGKTRTGAETIRSWVNQNRYRRIALIGDTIDEARKIMVEGESGLLSISPLKEKIIFEPSKGLVSWPKGAKAFLFSAHNYEKLRGPQFDAAWIDELAKFRFAEQTWDQLMFGLRLGKKPRVIITTTPKPIDLIKKLLKREDVVVTRGSTYDNAENLSPAFLENMRQRYERTRLGQQELLAQVLDTQEGALWTPEMIQYAPIELAQETLLNSMNRILIAIDPAVSHGERSDETGIIVVGKDHQGKGYIIEDLSMKSTPSVWAEKVVQAFKEFQADTVVAEVNNGGDLVERVLRAVNPSLSYRSVRATRGKAIRAEPITALYDQKRIIHFKRFKKLEEQLFNYIPGISKESPDRMDALVWGLTALFLEDNKTSPKVWII